MCQDVLINLISSIRGRIQLLLAAMHWRDDASCPSSSHMHLPSSCPLPITLSRDRFPKKVLEMIISLWKSLETPLKEVSVLSWILIHSYRTGQ